MSKITFEPGDVFSSDKRGCRGLVLKDGALLIAGSGGRGGFSLDKVDKIPSDARLSVPLGFEIRFAMKAVCVATGIPLDTFLFK